MSRCRSLLISPLHGPHYFVVVCWFRTLLLKLDVKKTLPKQGLDGFCSASQRSCASRLSIRCVWWWRRSTWLSCRGQTTLAQTRGTWPIYVHPSDMAAGGLGRCKRRQKLLGTSFWGSQYLCGPCKGGHNHPEGCSASEGDQRRLKRSGLISGKCGRPLGSNLSNSRLFSKKSVSCATELQGLLFPYASINVIRFVRPKESAQLVNLSCHPKQVDSFFERIEGRFLQESMQVGAGPDPVRQHPLLQWCRGFQWYSVASSSKSGSSIFSSPSGMPETSPHTAPPIGTLQQRWMWKSWLLLVVPSPLKQVLIVENGRQWHLRGIVIITWPGLIWCRSRWLFSTWLGVIRLNSAWSWLSLLILVPVWVSRNQCRLFVTNISSLPYAHDIHLVIASAGVEIYRRYTAYSLPYTLEDQSRASRSSSRRPFDSGP